MLPINRNILGVTVLFTLAISVLLNIILFSKVNYLQQLEDNVNVRGTSSEKIVDKKLYLQGNKEVVEQTRLLDRDAIKDKDSIRVNLNLHGLCVLNGEAGSVSIVARNAKEYEVALKDYVDNCKDGEQYIIIPLKDFFQGENVQDVRAIKFKIWYPTFFSVSIEDAYSFNNVLGIKTSPKDLSSERGKKLGHVNKEGVGDEEISATPSLSDELSPTAIPTKSDEDSEVIGVPKSTHTPTPTSAQDTAATPNGSSWEIRSVSSMKETKDRICNQRNESFIREWVSTAKELGVNYISISTPYDNPSCGDSLAYTRLWVRIIRDNGLNVWHRHMPIAFEGIYDTGKNAGNDYLSQIESYIRNNPDLFEANDIFTPIPEPQNGGIQGVTYCSHGVCIFNDPSHFNSWLRDAMDKSNNAFNGIGKSGVKVGYWGFDGFVAWGDNNPDWNGILEDETVAKMGNITIDHYPEIVGDSMENDLNELRNIYPNTPIIIGEWGAINGENKVQSVENAMDSASNKDFVIGFNYWHMGIGGNESLILEDFTKLDHFDVVKKYFSN